MDKPQQRAQAVRATIGASTSLLDPLDADRFTELGVFAEDEVIPLRLVARLWQVTAGLENRDELQAAEICERLAQLALVSHAAGPAPGITVHDVVRDFLRADLGSQRLADLNGKLLDAVASGLPVASPLAPGLPAVRVAWWDLGPEERYLWDHLIEHLIDAEGREAAGAVAGDLRWVGARLERFGRPRQRLTWPWWGHLARRGCKRCWRVRRIFWRLRSRPGRWWMFCIAVSPMTRTGGRRRLPCVTSAPGRGLSAGGCCLTWPTRPLGVF